MRLHLIRHPPPAVAADICYGQTDLALLAPVDDLAGTLRATLPPDAPVFSSPLRRCRELARALHPSPVLDERLMEMNFGAWEMQAWSSINRVAIDTWADEPLNFAPPGGEPVAHLVKRVHDFFDELEQRSEPDVIVVTHAGVIKVVAGERQGAAQSDWLRLTVGFGSVTQVDRVSARA